MVAGRSFESVVVSKKFKWGRNAGLFGLAVFLADFFFVWGGITFLPWTGVYEVAFNIGQVIGFIGIGAVIGFLFGALADALTKKV